MAAATALSNRHIVATVLHHFSSMKYKDRRQYGPDLPVEFLECRPSLLPAILVNRLWADEGTNILWRQYPHVPALRGVAPDRRQWYANKVESMFAMSPLDSDGEELVYLEALAWPNTKALEFEVDFSRHGQRFKGMLHSGLEHLEISGSQTGGSKHFAETVLPMVAGSCTGLQSIRIGTDTIMEQDPIDASVLFNTLDSIPSITSVEVKDTNFSDKDALFVRLSQRPDFESLEIDLDPGLGLLPLLSGPNALPSPFSSLRRLWIMCYPEVALALPVHLRAIEEMQLEIARIPNEPAQSSDRGILGDLIEQLSHCPNLRLLRIGIGLLASDFPSALSLPALSGNSLIKLATCCPNLININIFAIEHSAIDGSNILPDQFDDFCKALPGLRSLNLKLHPPTATALSTTALQSLGAHCPGLEVLRLKIGFQLPSLPVSSAIPQILLNGEDTPGSSTFEDSAVLVDSRSLDTDTTGTDSVRSSTDFVHLATPSTSSSTQILPMFPNLSHLAMARAETALCPAIHTPSTPEKSLDLSTPSLFPGDIDPDTEASLVRAWALPLLTHFPRLEILEAWGDHMGQDNESLNYFFPKEEVLASTWEFLAGVEQDLWEGGEDMVLGDDENVVFEQGYIDGDNSSRERDSWHTLDSGAGSGEDWHRASLMNEFVPVTAEKEMEFSMGGLAVCEGEPVGTIMPGKRVDIVDPDGLFTEVDILNVVGH
ncbi:hypothetical protein P280DRAFT_392319 [Massarina eburnea CBS 473.64]|uniref:RNI-like protein n=1 Tax=Massarina eburnea CBS 473.64 TaxID=1395130 RepID=A0A6A6S9C5_9PLEO|nr:hypothetical protein P280DRAFT_392319 [Massarina eburnea CBS 473.64]